MSDPVCRIPLGVPPVVTQMGIGIHGPGRQRFRLADRWCLHLYTYHCQMEIDGVPVVIVPGSAGITPADATTVYDFPSARCAHTYAHFKLPSGAGALPAIPLMQDLGVGFAAINKAVLEAVGWHPITPQRAEARLWDVLWQLTGDPDAATLGHHPAVERARHFIERNLARRMTVAAIARDAGCSHNHLVRLFRAQLGITIVGYVRRRRAERAAYLLRHSAMPIKHIPGQIGLKDLHTFNKTVRRELGRSPRAIRRG